MAETKPKSSLPKVAGSMGAGAGFGVVVVWAWNGFLVPAGAPEMGVEVAAALVYPIQYTVKWMVSWIPKPEGAVP